MKPTKEWTLPDAHAYNQAADRAGVRSRKRETPKDAAWTRRLRGQLRAPVQWLLGVLYADRAALRALREPKALEPVFRYTLAPLRGVGARLAIPKREVSEGELRRAQPLLHAAAASLIFVRNGTARAWKLPPLKILRLTAVRPPDAFWALGPEGSLHPASLELVLLGGYVLVDALPWLRFCDLCGRLFFKVRRQRFCGQAHAKVYAGRQRVPTTPPALRQSKLGRPLLDFSSRVEALHAAWLTLKK